MHGGVGWKEGSHGDTANALSHIVVLLYIYLADSHQIRLAHSLIMSTLSKAESVAARRANLRQANKRVEGHFPVSAKLTLTPMVPPSAPQASSGFSC